ncbi:unnamed protein product, partial [Rotaria socialis]
MGKPPKNAKPYTTVTCGFHLTLFPWVSQQHALEQKFRVGLR